jgi:hypothetical protein
MLNTLNTQNRLNAMRGETSSATREREIIAYTVIISVILLVILI